MDLTAIFLGFFGLLKLLTIMAFVLAIIFIVTRGSGKRRMESRWRNHCFDGENKTIVDDISQVAERMEKRLEALEKILEADDPKWKERAR